MKNVYLIVFLLNKNKTKQKTQNTEKINWILDSECAFVSSGRLCV